jgi:hypothetical protein
LTYVDKSGILYDFFSVFGSSSRSHTSIDLSSIDTKKHKNTQTPIIIIIIITMADSSDSSDDDDIIIQSMLAAQYAMSGSHIPGVLIDELFFTRQTSTAGPPVQIDMRGKNNKDRSKRREFDHTGALNCIKRDYLGPDPLFGSSFKAQFRISLSRFQCLYEDVGNLKQFPFFAPEPNVINKNAICSLEARLLLPLKTYAYGVPPKCFCDYFQMSFLLASAFVKGVHLSQLT